MIRAAAGRDNPNPARGLPVSPKPKVKFADDTQTFRATARRALLAAGLAQDARRLDDYLGAPGVPATLTFQMVRDLSRYVIVLDPPPPPQPVPVPVGNGRLMPARAAIRGPQLVRRPVR